MNLKQMAKDKGVTAVKGISPIDLPKILAGDMEPDDEQLTALASALGVSKAELKKMMSGKAASTDMSESNVSSEEFSELQRTVKELTAKLAITEAQASNLEKENLRLAAEREDDRINSFVEKLVSDRKLRPTEKDATIQELKWLPNDNPVEFSEGGQTVSKTPRQIKMDRLANAAELYSVRNLPTGPEHDPTNFSEQQNALGLDNVDLESVKQDRMIRAKQTEMATRLGRAVDYSEAANELVNTGALSL